MISGLVVKASSAPGPASLHRWATADLVGDDPSARSEGWEQAQTEDAAGTDPELTGILDALGDLSVAVSAVTLRAARECRREREDRFLRMTL